MRYYVMPEDDYEPWEVCKSINEAREERSKLAFNFFSRNVVIRDENYQIIQ